MSTTSSEKRFRTPRACDSCKRKKKQCSGTQPCSLCHARSQTCVFSNTPASAFSAANRAQPKDRSPTSSAPSEHPKKRRQRSLDAASEERRDVWPQVIANESSKAGADEDETLIQDVCRMLRDGEGRLLYVGDSASLSFLHTLRRLVESTLGASAFTTDSNRHTLLEATFSTSPHYQHTFRLPDIEAALYLTENFFNTTTGLFQIFDKDVFVNKVKDAYANPLLAEPQWLCQLHLVFAVSMQFRRDLSGPPTRESKIFQRLDAQGVDRSELFFLASKHLGDPIYGFEDGGLASIQSLLLMTIYMLTASKRNTAWAYLGMATRLSYALGLHKEETMSAFSPTEQALRRKLWKSLYVMDNFLSSSLGRPSSISLHELPNGEGSFLDEAAEKSGWPHSDAFHASYTASRIVGEVLDKVYQTRKASRTVTLDISMHFNDWMKALPTILHWQRLSRASLTEVVNLSQIHLNLIYFHGIILLTRPFLLHQVNRTLKRASNMVYEGRQSKDKGADFTQFNCFHGACVRAAVHSIIVVQTAYARRILPRRDPFVIYWLFSAGLVVLANSYCPVHYQPDEQATIETLLQLLRYMGESDLSARRYLHIMESFNEAIQNAKNPKLPVSQDTTGQNIFNVLFGYDESSMPDPESTQTWSGGIIDESSNATNTWNPNTQISQSPMIPCAGGMNSAYVQGPPNNLPWTGGAMGTSQVMEDAIDFDSFWWATQTNETVNGDAHVPLYGLMKPM